jgi:hypothetical protein
MEGNLSGGQSLEWDSHAARFYNGDLPCATLSFKEKHESTELWKAIHYVTPRSQWQRQALEHARSSLDLLWRWHHPASHSLPAMRHDSQYVASNAKEALNFQISVFLYVLCCLPLALILIGVPLMILIGLGSLVLAVLAAVRASQGQFYRYPLTLRLVS